MSDWADPFERAAECIERHAFCLRSGCLGRDELETWQLLGQAVRKFAERHLDPERLDREAALPAELMGQLKELGLFGLTIPRQYGGSGLSMPAACEAVALLGELDASVAVTVGLHNGLGLRGLIYYGSEALRQRYLPALAEGRLIAAFAVTETEAGSDIASLRTTARLEGDRLTVDGSKCYITNAGFAGLTTLLARTPGLAGARRGQSLLLLPMDLPGVERGAEEHKLGIRATSTRGLFFNGVRIGQDHLLGEAGKGAEQFAHVLTWGRTFMAAGATGLSRAAARLALRHAVDRRQFGRPIAEFGQVREMLARGRSLCFAMESLIRLVTALEQERPASIGWESSVAKLFCSEAAWQVADDAVQIHGGSGYLIESGVERLLRDCRISRIFEGANELLRLHLAAALLSSKPKDPGAGVSSRVSAELRQTAGRFDECLSIFRLACAEKKKSHGLKLLSRQMDCRRVAEAAVSLYTMLAVLLRAEAEARAGALGEKTLLCTRHVQALLEERLRASLSGLKTNCDELTSRLAALECESAGLKLSEEGL